MRATHGVPDQVETVLVRHGGGGDVQAGTSRLTIKTYDQGRAPLVTLTNSQAESNEAARIIAETESWVRAAVKMARKSISGEWLQAVLDGDSVTLLPVVKEASTVVNEVSQ